MNQTRKYGYFSNFCRWHVDNIIKYVQYHSDDEFSYSQYLQENLVFLTFNFNNNDIRKRLNRTDESYSVGQLQFGQFNHFYNLVCRRLLGRRYVKEQEMRKPLCLVCLDSSGTRYWKEMGDISNLHLHSIWVMPPNGMEPLQEIVEQALSMSIFSFREIFAKSFEIRSDYRSSLKKLVSYNFKLDRFNRWDAEIQDIFRNYPLVKDGPNYGTHRWAR